MGLSTNTLSTIHPSTLENEDLQHNRVPEGAIKLQRFVIMAESPPDRAADALSAVEQPFRFFDLPRELRNAIYPQFRSSSRATRAFCRRSVRSAQFCLTGPYLPN